MGPTAGWPGAQPGGARAITTLAPVNGAAQNRPLRLCLLGTRGVPAHYGGFETAVEEIGRRLVERGHEVTVYCRRGQSGEAVDPEQHLGMRLHTLPAVRARSLETLTHSALAALHTRLRPRHDVVFLFNSANSVFLPVIRRRGVPVAVHVDGLEWKRAKWSGTGRRYYRSAESLAVRWADALIADAGGIASYYRDTFGATTELLTYGAPVLEQTADDKLGAMGLEAGRFHLVVARFEPENHIDLMVRGYRASRATLPLVVVGTAPYGDAHTAAIHAAAEGDPRIRFVGPVWDQQQLDQLYAHALLYLHGHSVGGTNPSLLRAMGAGTAVAAFDVVFNREVLGEGAQLFGTSSELSAFVERAEADPASCASLGSAHRTRVQTSYRWDDVAAGYEELAQRLVSGHSRRREVTGRRRDDPA